MRIMKICCPRYEKYYSNSDAHFSIFSTCLLTFFVFVLSALSSRLLENCILIFLSSNVIFSIPAIAQIIVWYFYTSQTFSYIFYEPFFFLSLFIGQVALTLKRKSRERWEKWKNRWTTFVQLFFLIDYAPAY